MISVIVPVYNVEEYIKECINSITSQTYRDIEIILVDDGSTDSSPMICDNYAALDDRVKVIHKPNGGLSSARNEGISVSTGTYIGFVDSDDIIRPDTYRVLFETAQRTSSSIIGMKYRTFEDSDDYAAFDYQDTYSIVKIEALDYLGDVFRRIENSSCCCKLFKRSVFDEVRFAVNKLNEDFLFLANALIRGYTIATVDYAGYLYRTRLNSLSRSGFSKAMSDCLKNAEYVQRLLPADHTKLQDSIKYMILYQCRNCLIMMPFNFVKERDDEFRKVAALLNTNKKSICKVGLHVSDMIILKAALFVPLLTKSVIMVLRRIR